MEFNDFQKDIIAADIGNILVSAAAGSGKTTVLVERIIQKILNGSLSLDNVLVLTFTKAAAENMQVKIGNAIREKLESEADPANRKLLKEQLNLLPGSYIQTINGFCTRVIKEKGSELSDDTIEPGMALLSEAEKKMILGRAAKETVDDMYLSFEDVKALSGSDFYFLTEYFGDGRSDVSLVDHMVNVYGNLRSLPDYIQRLDELLEQRREADRNGDIFMLDKVVRIFMDMFQRASEDIDECLMTAYDFEFVKSKANAERIALAVGLLSVVKEEIGKVLATGDRSIVEQYDQIRSSFKRIADTESFGFVAKDDKAAYASLLGPIAALQVVCSAKPCVAKDYYEPFTPGKECIGLTVDDLDLILQKQKRRTDVIAVFTELMKKMDEKYQTIKKRLHVMDYSDQEHYAHKILKCTNAGEYYREKFAEIYVDEYQDNSSLQDSTIALIAKDNVFMVGDVKQSIYKFRYANPQMFLDRYNAYEKGQGGTRFLLNYNYRSTPEILDFVNVIFEQLMSSDATEIEYDESQKLAWEDKTPRGNDLPSVVLLSGLKAKGDGEEDEEGEEDDEYAKSLDDLSFGLQAEVKCVVSAIKEYLEVEGHKLSDICLLTRTNDKCRVLSSILNSMGLPVVCSENKSIYDDPDVAVLCSLITLIANEHRDECMIGVLLSDYRFSNFTLNEVAMITALAAENGLIKMDLSVKLRFYAGYDTMKLDRKGRKLQERVVNFLRVFDDLRSDCLMLNISELIETIFAKTGIIANLKEKSMDDVIKIRSFKNWLCENYMSRGSDISSIAASLEALKLEVKDAAAFEFETAHSDAISCMTFHKSKGLEFPFVIISNIDIKPRASDPTNMIFDEKFGFVCDDYSDDDLPKRYKSLEHIMYDREEQLASISESLRLFYVALTRAKKKLTIINYKRANDVLGKEVIYVGSEPGKQISRENHMRLKNISNEFKAALFRMTGSDILSSGHEVRKPINFNGYTLTVLDANDLELPEKIEYAADNSIRISASPECIHTDENGEPVFDAYKYDDVCTSPAKTSVSEIKREEVKKKKELEEGEDFKANMHINLIVPKKEYFDRKFEYKSPSSQGSLIHDLLRYLDFVSMQDKMREGASAEEALASEISFLEEQGIIKEKMKPVIEKFQEPLARFIKSDLFNDIADAERNDQAFFERPVMFSLKVDEEDDTLVQGVIDVIYFKDGVAQIVDYKTDRIKTEDLDYVRNVVKTRHGLQLDLYAAAVEASGTKVASKVVWLIRDGIKIDL